MNINDYILDEIKALSLNNSVKCAQKLCKNLPITHIPVVDDGKLIGCLPESDIQTIEDKNHKLSEYTYLLDIFHTNENASLLDLITLFADNDCNLIPVLNKNHNYIGYYELSDILDAFADSPFLHNESETLTVEKSKNDYSMSEVSQIIEANNGKLLGLYISSESRDSVQITLNVISEEINEIIQTFRRYDYNVITKHEDDIYLEDLKNRADYLKKYLDM
ncbi:CBS domain-containing protein [Tenacibaculum maritimum]|uniref:CBS domain-containing protein n=1 Tax=Tenacibaculum maritimum NCIMB 2154 TaxID=1349785 RepID=A0A2H1EDJ2_9FLAO|nr:CBS domain-containing protein [Tenacibaculum maritimum]MCD9562523.1 CBS domain-containing protein [Tenacibaculum maritimum]MCD9564902.1 CBS domain-containing protein [Tenacibaculum maritimum]MCD9577681.1 CBS domain-containing protein [Tenacibaculum maritimum]MCD9583703.1 CBS domain-containing protein [Tenacibaculum maritimum]MCD9595657.1 CBS domain-containing protein [Tenacibaculum maritimum]